MTLRAAVAGVIDFSTARIRDVAWWRRTNALIHTMAAADAVTELRLAYDYQRCLISNSDLSDESFKAAQQKARDLFTRAQDTLSPWAANSAVTRQGEQFAAMRAAYAKYVEDPDTPEFRRKLAADLAKQEAAAVAPPVAAESDDQRIDRLIQSRDAKRR